jgi:hypothetical protein
MRGRVWLGVPLWVRVAWLAGLAGLARLAGSAGVAS